MLTTKQLITTVPTTNPRRYVKEDKYPK